MMPKSKEVEWLHCNNCSRFTRHNVLFSKDKCVKDYDSGEERMFYQVIECIGCSNVSYRSYEWCSGQQNEYDDGRSNVIYYPPRISRRLPAWFEELPEDIRAVLTEVYTALHAGSRYLATLGARTILDLLFTDKIGDIGTFNQKIEKLQEKGYITKVEYELIDAVIEAGNASAHRGYSPDSNSLNHVMDILEAVLDKLYAAEGRQKRLAAQAAALKKTTPPRKS